MTSDGSWSTNLRIISDLERPDHHHLESDDECYFLGDYTPREGFKHSEANQLIWNLKKSPKFKGHPSWFYKNSAIKKAGATIGRAVNNALADVSVLIPIPPSKPVNHPEYDDRMIKVALAAQPFRTELLLSTREARDAAHQNDAPRSIEAVYQSLDHHPQNHQSGNVAILIDDVLTTGASFKAAKRKILELGFFDRVIGVFVARRTPPRFTALLNFAEL